MAIERFEELIGTWQPAETAEGGDHEEWELFHFSPLGHFVVEWTDGTRPHVQISDLALTEEGFEYTNPRDGSSVPLRASLCGERLVLVPPGGSRTILRRVVEELEAEDFEFFVEKGRGEPTS